MKKTEINNASVFAVKPPLLQQYYAHNKGHFLRARHICPSRTILHCALNEQTASSHRSYFMPHLLNAQAALQVYKYACTIFIIDGLGNAMWSLTMPVSRFRMASF